MASEQTERWPLSFICRQCETDRLYGRGKYFMIDIVHAGCKTYGCGGGERCAVPREQHFATSQVTSIFDGERYCQHDDDVLSRLLHGGSVHRPLNVGKCGKSTSFVYMKQPLRTMSAAVAMWVIILRLWCSLHCVCAKCRILYTAES
jgi:hypothetical protein